MISIFPVLLFKEEAIVGTSTKDELRLDFKDNLLGLALGVAAGDLGVDGIVLWGVNDPDGVVLWGFNDPRSKVDGLSDCLTESEPDMPSFGSDAVSLVGGGSVMVSIATSSVFIKDWSTGRCSDG